MIPYKNTFGTAHFNKPLQNVLYVLEFIILFVFWIDVVIGFRRAYLNDNYQIVKDPKKIAIKYLKFFFWVDTLSAFPFDYFVKEGFLRYIGLIKVFRLLRLKTAISNLGLGASMRAKIRIIQLIIVLLISIHLTTCYLYATVSKNYFDLGTDSFDLNYWMPPVDLNDFETPYYSDPE